MNRPPLSVIVPCYRLDSRLVERALQSLAIQHYQELEVVLLRTEDSTFSYAESEPTLRLVEVVTDSELSIPDARNRGVRHATSDWVMWLDGDDELAPGAIDSLVDASGGTAPLTIGRCIVIEDGIETLRPSSEPFFVAEGAGTGQGDDPFALRVFALQPQMFARGAFEALGGFDLAFTHGELTGLLRVGVTPGLW